LPSPDKKTFHPSLPDDGRYRNRDEKARSKAAAIVLDDYRAVVVSVWGDEFDLKGKIRSPPWRITGGGTRLKTALPWQPRKSIWLTTAQLFTIKQPNRSTLIGESQSCRNFLRN